MMRNLPAVLALIVVLASGVVHGVWTDRWATDGTVAAAVTRLNQVALTLGDWQGQDTPFDPKLIGPVGGFLHRRYHNQRTGATIAVSLACGRPGPISIHTPDVCYVASGFDPAASTTYSLPLSPSSPGAEFKTAQFVKSKSAEQVQLRVFWSWNAGGVWQVSDSPRFAFTGQRVLYKLHLVREMSSPSEPLDDDPCVEFMQLLLPELQNTVLSPS
jgi:hypothetical protein